MHLTILWEPAVHAGAVRERDRTDPLAQGDIVGPTAHWALGASGCGVLKFCEHGTFLSLSLYLAWLHSLQSVPASASVSPVGAAAYKPGAIVMAYDSHCNNLIDVKL